MARFENLILEVEGVPPDTYCPKCRSYKITVAPEFEIGMFRKKSSTNWRECRDCKFIFLKPEYKEG